MLIKRISIRINILQLFDSSDEYTCWKSVHGKIAISPIVQINNYNNIYSRIILLSEFPNTEHFDSWRNGKKLKPAVPDSFSRMRAIA